MNTSPSDDEAQITLKRTIDAPLEDIFAAWTDPALLEQWLADEADVEPYPGGAYRFTTLGDDEDPREHIVSGEYIDFIEDSKISMSWVYQDPDNQGDELIFVLEIQFTATKAGQTTINLVERGLPHADPESRIFSMEAWSATLEHLAELLE